MNVDVNLNERLYEIDYRLNRAMESILQSITIYKIFGPIALDIPYNVNNEKFYSLIHVLRKVVDGCFNDFILGIASVFDHAKECISLPNTLKYAKNLKGMDVTKIDAIFERINSFSDVRTGNEVFLRIRTLRDKVIAHADKSFKEICLENMSEMHELFVCEVVDFVKEVYEVCDFNEGGKWTLYENENPIEKVVASYLKANDCDLGTLIN